MLGKLIKHEWKSVYKLNSIILLVVLIMTVLGCLIVQTPLLTNLFSEEVAVDEMQAVIAGLMTMVGIMAFILMIVGATYGVIIYQGAHFYKSMYSEQGYLTHTLPVKPHQLLISKLLVSGVWSFLVNTAVVLSILAVVFSVMIAISDGIATDINFMQFQMEMSMIQEEMGFQAGHIIGVYCLLIIISPFTSMIMLFGALTIGQLSKKHKLLMGIVAYFGIYMVNSIAASIVQTVIMFYYALKGMEEYSMEYLAVTYDSVLIITCVISVVLYFVSHRIVKNKLNME